MTRITRLFLFIPIITFLAWSCGNEKPTTESEEVSTEIPFHENSEMDSYLVIGHKVDDYSTWKAAYDLSGPVREKHGIKTQMVLQGFSEENMAMVLTHIDNVDQAKEYVTSENLKRSMEVAGVEGEMDLFWLKHRLESNSPSKKECIVYMSFKVSDFEAWKKAFIGDFETEPNKDFDVLHVFQSIENANEVSMIFAAESPEFVADMQSNTSFRMKMLASGVVSYPQTFIMRQKQV